MGRWVVRGMLGLALVLGSGLPGWGATRLGLHVTQEERTIWQQRMIDNVNGINGSTYQAIYQQRILADANAFRSQSHPGGDGYWAGYTGAGCVPSNDQSVKPGSGSLGAYGRGNGAALARAALVFLLTGDTSYANAVKTELVNQASVPGTDFTNNSKWCLSPGCAAGCAMGGGNMLEVIPWIYRVLLAYDYLKAGGYTGWTTAEENAIRTWLLNSATRWDGRLVESSLPSPYPGMFNTPQDLTLVGGSGSQISVLWYGGPTLWYNTYFPWYNQPSNVAGLSMAAGLMFNDAAMIDHGKKWFTGFLTAGTWSNGAIGDFYRWTDCSPPCPGSMWGHAMSPTGWMILIADLLARTGDTSLYDLSVTSQVIGGGGGTVDFQKTLKLWADMVNDTVVLYGTTNGGDLTSGRILTWDSDLDPGRPTFINTGNYYDFASMAANLYYNNSAVHTAMTRTLKGSNNNVGGGLAGTGCNDNQMGGCFSGTYVWWPDLPFMFGNMEGQVNPYSLASSAIPTLSLTAPTTYASITVSGATLTLSGPASDDVGVASVTWARTSPSGSGSATCNPACGGGSPPMSTTWTITDLDLPADGQSTTVTVTVSDGDDPVQTAQVVLTVTRQDTPDITSTRLLWLQLNDGGGPTAADSSGQSPPNTGTLQGGATWGSGHTGGGIVLDGVDDAISLTSDLGQPSVLTLAAWVNLSGGTESATLLNLGNRVGLRIDAPASTRRPTSFWYDGSTYPNLVSGTAFPASGWHHVAMTMSASRQVLYLDGVVVGMGAGVAPTYTGSTGTSMSGRHVSTSEWDLQGTLDDVRVYGRALSEVDMTALVAGEALSIQITTPTSAATYERTTEPLITLSGSAYGTSVTVTWACVGCQTNPSGEATFTPPTWTVANIPLATGSGNVITVTATDGALDTAQDDITVTYSPPQDTLANSLRLRLAQ